MCVSHPTGLCRPIRATLWAASQRSLKRVVDPPHALMARRPCELRVRSLSMPASLTAVQRLIFSQDPGALRQLVALLEETATTPRPSRQLQVHAQLGGLLQVASHFVPYYRERLPAWCRDGLFDAARFTELPILKRSDLQEFGAQLENTRPPEP